MRIGILGSGNMGGALGALFAAQGHEIIYSFARTREPALTGRSCGESTTTAQLRFTKSEKQKPLSLG